MYGTFPTKCTLLISHTKFSDLRALMQIGQTIQNYIERAMKMELKYIHIQQAEWI